MNHKGPLLLLTLTLFLAFIGFTCAQTTFYEAYQSGLQLEKEGKWKEARDRFLEAASLHPFPSRRVRTYGLNFIKDYDPFAHLAHCEVELGMLEEAQKHLEMSRRAAVMPAKRLLELKKRLDLEIQERQRVQAVPPETLAKPAPAVPEQKMPAPAPPVLKVESSPPGANVKIDGEERGVTPLEITLSEGSHTIACFLKGYQAGQQTVDLTSGDKHTIKVVLSQLPRPIPQEKPRSVSENQIPTENEIETSAPASTAIQEKTLEQARESAGSLPLQKKETRSGGKGDQRMIVLLLLLTAALLGLFTLRKYKALSTQPVVSSAAPDPATGKLLDDGMTTDLRLEDLKPVGTSRVSNGVLERVKTRCKELPQGIPKDLGQYELLAMLGRGGMATTFLAKRIRDGLPAAIKVPHKHMLDNPEFTQRFLREGSLGSTLHHPNIIRILEANQAGNTPFIAMELLQGETLENKLSTLGRLSLREALEIARDVALALDYARLKGIVHRDLKPENIMILARGGLKVLDYGIARIMDAPGLTASEAFLGTPSYSAPESTRSEEIDQQSDLYSLGIILYRCLSGTLPFRSQNIFEMLNMHRTQPLPPFPAESSIPGSVFELVQKLAAKKKSDRFPNAEIFLIELNRVLNQLEA